MNGEILGVRANYVARIRGSQWLDCYRLSVLSQYVMARYAKSCSTGATYAIRIFQLWNLRWEIPDPSMIYVLETSDRKTHQIDCPQHMSLAQTDSSILACTPQQTYHPKTSIDLPKVAKFPGKRQVVWLFQGYFLSAWHFAILGRCAWKIAMETCWWAQLRSASRSERVNWSNWDILTKKKQFGSIKSLEHFWDLRIWSKSPWILTFKSQLGRWSLRSQFRIAVCCGRPWVWVKAWCPAPFQNVTQTERSHERVISPSV